MATHKHLAPAATFSKPAYLQEDFLMAQLPVLAAQVLLADLIGGGSAVLLVGRLDPHHQHSVTIHKLLKSVADRVTRTTDSKFEKHNN